MRNYLWKVLLFFLCSVPLWEQQIDDEVGILLIIASLLLLLGFSSRFLQIISILLFLILGYYFEIVWYFIPLIFYQSMYHYAFYSLSSFILLIFLPSNFLYTILLMLLGGFLAYFEKERENNLKLQVGNLDFLRYKLMEEEKSIERIEKEYEQKKQMAILQERNRIARSVHDAVGHSLSRAIIQLQAIQIKSTAHQAELSEISNTLQSGMNDIRNSLHNLYDESFNLEKEIESLSQSFHLPIQVQIKINENFSYAFKYGILSVIKEALSNIRKHSDADKTPIKWKLLS